MEVIIYEINILTMLFIKTIIRIKIKLERFIYIFKVNYEIGMSFLNLPNIFILLASKFRLPASFFNLYITIMSYLLKIHCPINCFILIFQP